MRSLVLLLMLGTALADQTTDTTDAAEGNSCELAKNQTITLDNGVGYYFGDRLLNFTTASNFCSGLGLEIPTVETKEHLQMIWEASPNDIRRRALWVSANNIGHDLHDIQWTDGRKIDSTWWKGGEPNNHKKDGTCVFLYDSALWDDGCGAYVLALCRVPKHCYESH